LIRFAQGELVLLRETSQVRQSLSVKRWLSRSSALLTCWLASLSLGCLREPPPSRFPNAAQILAQVAAQHRCSRGLRSEGKLDYFGDEGRVRVNTWILSEQPQHLRLDLVSPFGVPLATLTSDGKQFALLDHGAKAFYRGPANQCSVESFLHVPIPAQALLQLLSGEAPLLKHLDGSAQLNWEQGAYVVNIAGEHGAEERIELEVVERDWMKPYGEQQLRVRRVTLRQHSAVLYDVELRDYALSRTAGPRKDPEGLEPDVLPSGPVCNAETPRNIRFQVPNGSRDVLVEQKEVEHNAPLLPAVFTQEQPAGTKLRQVPCSSPRQPVAPKSSGRK
jgi:Outer membrane lipoprotein LolB